MLGFDNLHQNRRSKADSGRFGRKRISAIQPFWVLVLALSGCATQGDFLSLQEKVAEHHRPNREAPDPFARIAQLSSEVDAMRDEIRAVIPHALATDGLGEEFGILEHERVLDPFTVIAELNPLGDML